jgi:hypothetical protein
MPSSAYRFIDLSFRRLGNLRDHRPVRRIHVGELTLSGHEAAIDVILN